MDPSERLREAFSRWPAGVAVVAARDGNRTQGITVTAFTPLSLEPPLILVCLHQDAPVLDPIQDAGRFTVNFLAADQKRIANIFADRFQAAGVNFSDGDPLLEDAPVSLRCALHALHPGGDHRIVVGRVEEVLLREDAQPLVHARREYRTTA